MKLTRRQVMQLGLGVGTSLLLPEVSLARQSAPLIQRPIPSTGERLPIVGIGTARRYNVTTAADKDELKEVVRLFSELGGKVIDTAPSYGAAEDVVGEIVDDLNIRDALFLGTKVRKEGRNAGLSEMETSRERLRTDMIDLVAVHNLVDTDTQLATLRERKAEGLIRYVGMTTSSDRQHDNFADKISREQIDIVQVNYSLDRRAVEDRILPIAADSGLAVWVNLPYGRGRLFDAVGDRPLPDWAVEFDCKSWGQFFLKYILGHPAVSCVIPGTARVRYVADNLGAAQGRLPDERQRQRMVRFIESL